VSEFPQLNPFAGTPLDHVETVIEDFAAARSLADAFAALRSVVGRMGLEFFTYELTVPVEGPQRSFYVSNYPAAWLTRYIGERYESHDIVCHHAARMVRPFLWSEITHHPHLTEPQRRIVDESAELGLRAGAIVPIHGPGPVKAYLSVGNDTTDDDFAGLFRARRHELHVLTAYGHERILQLGAGSEAPSLALSPRELEILTWTARGKTVPEISELLQISAHTVRTHIENAATKLGALNKTHASSIAVAQGLIGP
jgi:LuxR family quorum sensing-dependent transcriptional regulator